MTGFGAASREAEGLTVRAEVKSVNSRGLAISVRAPGYAESLTPALEAAVKGHAARGTVSVSVQVQRKRAAAPARIRPEVILDYMEQASAIAEDHDTLEAPLFADLLRLPGVLDEAPADALSDAEAVVLIAAVDEACAAMTAMRDREGATLLAELTAMMDDVESAAARVAARSPASVLQQRDRLRERLAQLLAPGQSIPEDLVAREIALLADRTDVAEEVARLRSHVAQVREALAAGGPVGRRLDFLSQELAREANTIGSKGQDTEIARTVVDLKLVVERFKEQAANLE